MHRELRDQVHDLVIGKDGRPEPWKRGARAILTDEVGSLLEGVYGLDRTGRMAAPERLPAVLHDPEMRVTYDRVAQHLLDEQAAGLIATEAAQKLIREVAFTHLNRLVAFKMLEARGLIRETLRRGTDASGFKFYLADNPADEALWRRGDAETAYRHFLLWQSGQIAREVRVLFDQDNLASRLFPRPAALKEMLTLLNDDAVAPAWSEEETIGWVYQYFNEKEKADVFRRLYKEKQKIKKADIPAATQLFTPRWIVEFLVQNTLGRTWLQMHPDSMLASKMELLVPLAGEIPAERLKPVREITVLDPACGTMHFGLVAFDLLVEMYREELAHAGEPGWPAWPSVTSEADIPSAIVAHNLFGIDIDLRAVQLAALTLYLKAKTLNKAAMLRESNLASADVLPFREDDLTAFLAEMKFEDPIYERTLRALWPRFRELGETGSLARLEVDIARVVAEERKRRAKEEQINPLFANLATGSDRQAGDQEAWSHVEDQIPVALDYYAKHMAERGLDTSFFVGETRKGLRLLDLMRHRYDVVLSNPPYLTNHTDTLKAALARDYPTCQSDTYAAFIDRCVEWLKRGGRLGMITQQSFMFITEFERFRDHLTSVIAIETVAQLGKGAFEEISGEKVSTVMFAVRDEETRHRRDQTVGKYFELTTSQNKLTRLKQALAPPASGFTLLQSELSVIPRHPWVYWMPKTIRNLFVTLPNLSSIARPRAGMHGADVFRFSRFWWEVGIGSVARNCADKEEFFETGRKWVPYMKGGSPQRWYGNQEFVLAFDQHHYQILSFSGNKLPSREFYFREGVTFPKIGSGAFTARWSPRGFIFDSAGSSAFPEDVFGYLAFTNSWFAEYAVKCMNPTINTQSGDIARIPTPTSFTPLLGRLAQRAVTLSRLTSTEQETTYDFSVPPNWHDRSLNRRNELAEIEMAVNEEVSKLLGISPIEKGEVETRYIEVSDQIENAAESLPDDSVEMSSANEPISLWLSYAVGIVLGRFQPGVDGALGSAIVEEEDDGETHQFTLEIEDALRSLADEDGIAPLNEGHPDDLAAKTEHALELMLGDEEAARVLHEGANGNLRTWLEKEYWQKHHLKWYRKRPPYWLIQSPKKLYSLYVFHERVTSDTLFVISQRYLLPKMAGTHNAIAELTARVATAAGRDKRTLEKEIEAKEALLADLAEFARRIDAITAVGYDPHIDDGILICLAPLHTILPSFSKEPKECWEKLTKGDYDWSHMAMQHWPERVQAKCRTDKSLAIAHDRLDLYEGAR